MTNSKLSPSICALKNRAIIEVSGQDSRKFLQGLITNDMDTLQASSSSLYACMLTPQGKFLFDMHITLVSDDRFFLDVEDSRQDELIKKMTLYKLRAKVDITKRSGLQIFTLWNSSNVSLEESNLHTYQDTRHEQAGLRIIAQDSEHTEQSIAALIPSPDIIITSFDEYDTHRIKLGIPDGSRDMKPEYTTMAEANMDTFNGVSYTKGCYVGQEITARMHHRGLAKKRLYPLESLAEAFPENGESLASEAETIGEMRSSCGQYGIALIRDDKIPALKASGNFRLIP